MSTEPLSVGHSNYPFIPKVIESKWTDVALITSFAALLIIGILATTGVFSFMGTTNAAYLSYGMYAGAALLFVFETIKCVANRCLPNRASTITSATVVTGPLTPEEITNLKQKAERYANNDLRYRLFDGSYSTRFGTLDARQTHKAQMLQFINERIDNEEFQSNPLMYMENWNRKPRAPAEFDERVYEFLLEELEKIRTLSTDTCWAYID